MVEVQVVNSDKNDTPKEYLKKIEHFSYGWMQAKSYDEYSDGSVLARDKYDVVIYEKTQDGNQFWYEPVFTKRPLHISPEQCEKMWHDSNDGKQSDVKKVIIKEELKNGEIREYDHDDGVRKLRYEYIPGKHERRWIGEDLMYEKTSEGFETEWTYSIGGRIKIFESRPDGTKLIYNSAGKLTDGWLPNGTRLVGMYVSKGLHRYSGDFRGNNLDDVIGRRRDAPSEPGDYYKYLLSVKRADGIEMRAQFSLSGKIENIDILGFNDWLYKKVKQYHTKEEKINIQKQGEGEAFAKSDGLIKKIKERLQDKKIRMTIRREIKKEFQTELKLAFQDAEKMNKNLEQGILDSGLGTINFWQNKNSSHTKCL